MNKLRKFLGRISVESEMCLKMDYFGSKSQISPSGGSSAPTTLSLPPDPRFGRMTRECAKSYSH